MSDHLGGCYLDCPDNNTYCPDIWQKLADKYAIRSVLDVGCGAGWNTVWWHDRGYYAVGIEGWTAAIAATRMPLERVILHDYTKGPLKVVTLDGKPFDLAWCSEFVEHVEEQYLPNYMATFQCCHRVCLTYATPGQTGFHHVNEQPFEYWQYKMEQYGFKHCPEDTAWMRATDLGAAWGRKTLCLFRNVGLR